MVGVCELETFIGVVIDRICERGAGLGSRMDAAVGWVC